MDKQLQTYLDAELIAVLSNAIDKQGTLHSAALVFWNDPSSLQLYFVSSRASEKCTSLSEQASVSAACVIGTYNHTSFTLQLRGRLEILDHRQYTDVVMAYHTKRGNSHDDVTNPANTLLRFTPQWARFTDYKHKQKPIILTL
jgi:general stress protein 26